MIRGIGLELVRVAPYEQFLKGEGEGVDRAWFSDEELAYSRQRGGGGQHLAARHAAKLATLKALGLAPSHVGDVTVVREASGKPHIVLRPNGYPARHAGGTRLHLSMSHSGDYAVAMVVVEENDEVHEEVDRDESM